MKKQILVLAFKVEMNTDQECKFGQMLNDLSRLTRETGINLDHSHTNDIMKPLSEILAIAKRANASRKVRK